MDTKALEKKYKPIVEASGLFKFLSIEAVNFKPHPFMIGRRHVTYASDHCGGMLGDYVMKRIPCAHPGCRLMYSDHSHDTVMMLSLTRSAELAEAQATLRVIVDAGMADDAIDGFTFVETTEKFRII